MSNSCFSAFRRGVLLLGFAFGSALISRAAGGYEGSRWALLDAPSVIAAAGEVTPVTYPGCDEVTVDQNSVRSFRADGTGETQDETWTKVLTEHGKDGNRVLGLSFMIPYSSVEVVRLEVIHPDGTANPVDVAANSKESIDDSQMEMNIYDPNSKVLRVNIPQLEVGDTVHSVTRQTLLRPIIDGQYSDDFLFEGPGAIRHTTVKIYAPAAKDLAKVVIRNPVLGSVVATHQTMADGGKLYQWEVNNVPRIYDEPSMPSYTQVCQHLLVSTITDWKDVSKWYWGLSGAHLDAFTADMRAQVATLTAGAQDDFAKTKAIFYYVSKNIRYMGVTAEKDRPGFEPHDVSMTYDKKYGVCRDKAALLVSMLRLAGLRAYPVLTNYGAKRDPDVPSPDFNHAIAAVCLSPGVYTLMDATDEHTRDLLPSGEGNQSYLVCRPEGETLKTSEVRSPEENMLTVKTTGTLSRSGRLEATSTLAFGGINDNEFRSAMSQMKPDIRRQVFERLLSRAAPGVVLKDLKIEPENMLDTSVPVHAEISFAVDGMTASGGDTAVVNIPWLGRDFAIVSYLVKTATLDSRRYPYLVPSTCGFREEVALRLEPGYRAALSLPNCPPLADRSLAYQRSAQLIDGLLTSALEFELKAVEFSPSEYLQLKSTLTQLDYDNRKSPVLSLTSAAPTAETRLETVAAPTRTSSDVEILESTHTYDVQDEHAWTLDAKTRMKILTYNGKKENSEQKIAFDPACQTVRVVHATVIAPGGKRQEVSAGEQHQMDEGWSGGAGRYTGGKILVVNLPGVEVGSEIDLEFVIKSHNLPFLARFEAFQLNDALDAKTVRIYLPHGLALQAKVTGPAGVITENAGRDVTGSFQQWTAAHVQALPDEPDLPPDWTYRAGLALYVGDEHAYLDRLNELMVAHAGKSAKAAEIAQDLVKRATTPLEAIQAIRNYVATNVRDAGPGDFRTLPLSELSDADRTLSDGYGDSADRAIVYHAMLTAAGFKPEFVLGSGLSPAAEILNAVISVPLPEAFDAPLVRVRAGSETVYLNDTDQYAHLGSTPHQDRLVLSLPNPKPEVAYSSADGETRTERYCTLSISDDGDAQIHFRTLYFGAAFGEKHRFFAEVTPGDRAHYFEGLVSAVAHGAHAVGSLQSNFDSYPGVEEYTVAVDHFAITDGKYEYFPLPVGAGLVTAYSDQRVLPFYIGGQRNDHLKLEIDLPSSHRTVVIAPGSRDLLEPDGGGEARILQRVDGGKLVLDYAMTLAPTIVPTKDYEAMKQLEATLEGKSSHVILLEATPTPAPEARARS